MKNSSNNRGFAFIDYYNHACAEYSRQKMMNPKFKLDNNAPTVSWADPKNADSSPASQVFQIHYFTIIIFFVSRLSQTKMNSLCTIIWHGYWLGYWYPTSWLLILTQMKYTNILNPKLIWYACISPLWTRKNNSVKWYACSSMNSRDHRNAQNSHDHVKENSLQ